MKSTSPNTRFQQRFLLLALSFLTAFGALAAVPPLPTDSLDSAKQAKAALPVPPKPVVLPKTTGLAIYSPKETGKKDPKEFLLKQVVTPGSYLMVQTDSAGIALAQQNLDTFRLWIDGICFPKSIPLFIDELNSSLIFKLDRDTAATSPWQLFYNWSEYKHMQRDVIVQLGTLKTTFAGEKTVVLKTSYKWMLWVGYLLVIAVVALLVFVGKGVIRDVSLFTSNGYVVSYDRNVQTTIPDPNDPAIPGIVNIKDIPYSLARTQFLFWLIIIFFAIVHIWAITATLASPTGTVLLLLGISGGTFYIGRLLDKPKSTTPAPAPVPPLALSSGFMYDILNDGNAISVHRLQLVVFTVFLGIYFVWEMLYGLVLPQFSDTMMTLMGISSATYAGIKVTEG